MLFFQRKKISSNRTIAFRTTTGYAVAAIVSKTWRSIRRWRLKIFNFKKHYVIKRFFCKNSKGVFKSQNISGCFHFKIKYVSLSFHQMVSPNPNHEIWLFMNLLTNQIVFVLRRNELIRKRFVYLIVCCRFSKQSDWLNYLWIFGIGNSWDYVVSRWRKLLLYSIKNRETKHIWSITSLNPLKPKKVVWKTFLLKSYLWCWWYYWLCSLDGFVELFLNP